MKVNPSPVDDVSGFRQTTENAARSCTPHEPAKRARLRGRCRTDLPWRLGRSRLGARAGGGRRRPRFGRGGRCRRVGVPSQREGHCSLVAARSLLVGSRTTTRHFGSSWRRLSAESDGSDPPADVVVGCGWPENVTPSTFYSVKGPPLLQMQFCCSARSHRRLGRRLLSAMVSWSRLA